MPDVAPEIVVSTSKKQRNRPSYNRSNSYDESRDNCTDQLEVPRRSSANLMSLNDQSTQIMIAQARLLKSRFGSTRVKSRHGNSYVEK